MTRSSMQSKRLTGGLLFLLLLGLYWFYWRDDASEAFTPEHINDMFQNKASEVKVKKVELKSQQLKSPYLDKHSLKNDNWDFSGDIVVQNGQFISLTSDSKHQASNMFAKEPISAPSFEMELTFHIHGQGGLHADGLAIWFINEPSPIGDIFGARNNFEGLAIIVDTFQNGNGASFPYVSAHGGKGKYYFDKYSDGMGTKLAGCTAKSVLNPASGMTRMRIIHTNDGYLSLDLNYDPAESDEWHNCFTLMNVVLPEKKYFGLSAETGELAQSVDIIENRIFGVYSPGDGAAIHNVDELEHLIEEQESVAKEDQSPKAKKVRKSVMRLRKAEERIKKKEKALRLEKYGDADISFIRRMLKRVGKFIWYFAEAVLVFGVLAIAWKLFKNRRRGGYKRNGLLD